MVSSSNQTTNATPNIVLNTIIGLYVVSFFLPVTDAGLSQVMYGYHAFFAAIQSVLFIPMWLANPAFWVACIQYSQWRLSAARNAAAMAVLLSISEVWMWDDRPEIGYYVWVTSMVLLALASVLGGRLQFTAHPETSHSQLP